MFFWPQHAVRTFLITVFEPVPCSLSMHLSKVLDFPPGILSMLAVPSLLEPRLQAQRHFSKTLRQSLVSLVFLRFHILCMDELSHEFPLKPRPPSISAYFPGHGVSCLQKVALTGLPALLRSFSFQSSSHRISPT